MTILSSFFYFLIVNFLSMITPDLDEVLMIVVDLSAANGAVEKNYSYVVMVSF